MLKRTKQPHPPQGKPNRSAAGGFTLIELLVVIAIIAVLAAILFPVFAQARAKARQTACLSNMRQIGNGLMMYTQDYDETLPGNAINPAINRPDQGYGPLPLGWMDPAAGRNWAREVQPYVKNLSVFVCPQAKPRTQLNADGPTNPYREVPSPPGGNTSYLLNGIAATKALAAMPAPADTVYLHESIVFWGTAQERPRPDLPANPDRYREFNNVGLYDFVHNDGANLLFCDGHAKWQKKSSIRFTQFGAKPDGGARCDQTFAAGDATCQTAF
jgi:prepilin-type N-terminal cleavage/methylation domain-containing protein/prepilin-type processing-associated H-X9-DG protein